MWSSKLDGAVEKIKQSLTSVSTLSFFDSSVPTHICSDASRLGLGFILEQRSGDTWVLVWAGSRFLSDPESRYAIIELELS
jgi:hypothetical protein